MTTASLEVAKIQNEKSIMLLMLLIFLCLVIKNIEWNMNSLCIGRVFPPLDFYFDKVKPAIGGHSNHKSKLPGNASVNLNNILNDSVWTLDSPSLVSPYQYVTQSARSQQTAHNTLVTLTATGLEHMKTYQMSYGCELWPLWSDLKVDCWHSDLASVHQ